MPVLPDFVSGTVRAVYRLHETRRESEMPRGYLGISEIGERCSRRLWYGFHWCARPQFDGRMLRLFETGHREEARILDELRALGLEVSDRDDLGHQWSVVACSGHLRGHMDGAVRGLEEAPKTWHVFEAKTHNAKSFAVLKAKGVAEAQPRHYAQLQGYMGLSGMTRAAYFAQNKDTDELYLERVHYDKDYLDRLLVKAQSIIDATEPPERISDDPKWFECRYCPHHTLCHGVAAPPENCRTCAHSTPVADGQWLCEHYGDPIPFDVQLTGCEEHRFQPELVASFLTMESVEDGNVIVWRNKLNGAEVRQPDYRSREIHAATDKAFLGNEFVAALKAEFPGSEVVATRPVESGDSPNSDLEAIYGPTNVAGDAGRATRAASDAGCDQRELPIVPVVAEGAVPGSRRRSPAGRSVQRV